MMEILTTLPLAMAFALAGWVLANLNVWIFHLRQSRILRQWAARCPSVKANPSLKTNQFHRATASTSRIAEAEEDELERARR